LIILADKERTRNQDKSWTHEEMDKRENKMTSTTLIIILKIIQ